MKTLLSLTSRKFAMTRVRVLFNGPNEYGNVETQDDGIGVIQATTRGRLVGLLGDVRDRLGIFASAVALTLSASASAYGSDGQKEPVNGTADNSPMVIAIAQTGINTSLTVSLEGPQNDRISGVSKRVENVSVSTSDLLSILQPNYKYPIQTTDAIDYILASPPDVRARILNGGLSNESVFMQIYLQLNSLDPKLNHTPLPPNLAHTLAGKLLADDIAKRIDDPSISVTTLVFLTEVQSGKLVDHDDLYERYESWMKKELSIAKAENVVADQRLATADQRLAAAKAENVVADQRLTTVDQRLANIALIEKMLGSSKL